MFAHRSFTTVPNRSGSDVLKRLRRGAAKYARSSYKIVMGDNASAWDVPVYLASRVFGRYLTISSADGFRFVVDMADLRGAAEYLRYRRTEGSLCAFYRRFLRKGDTVVDIGSNIGYFAVLPAMLIGEAGSVVAFEPTPSTASVCRRNIALNKLERVVTLHECAASDIAGRATLFINPKYSGNNSLLDLSNVSAAGPRETVDVPVHVVDDVLGIDARVALLKIDVEGHELKTIRGIRRTLERNPSAVVVCEVAPRWLRAAGTDPLAIFQEFTETGREPYSIDRDGRVAKLDARAYIDLLDREDTGGNVAFVRSDAANDLFSETRLSSIDG